MGKVTTTTKNANKKCDYTAIVVQLWMVSWSKYSQPTDVDNRLTGPTFPLPATKKLPK